MPARASTARVVSVSPCGVSLPVSVRAVVGSMCVHRHHQGADNVVCPAMFQTTLTWLHAVELLSMWFQFADHQPRWVEAQSLAVASRHILLAVHVSPLPVQYVARGSGALWTASLY